METRQFSVGNPYYLVTYADEQLSVPVIETYFYLGTNIFADESTDDPCWYFQIADSYLEDGPFKKGNGMSADVLLTAGADMLDSFVDVDELPGALSKRGG